MTLCTWIPGCFKQGEHQVERETDLGMVVDDVVCERHLDDARRSGYRVRHPAESHTNERRSS